MSQETPIGNLGGGISDEDSKLVDSILNDYKKIIPCSVFLDGEYNLRDICIGVPCIIGANGVESIIDIELNQSEKKLLSQSAVKVREMNTAHSDFL